MKGYSIILFLCICLPVLIVGLGAESAAWTGPADSSFLPTTTITSTPVETPANTQPPVVETVWVYHQNAPVEMELEEYIVGVVLAEMPASFELEALKAQAVAARTYTYQKQTGENKDHPTCMVCTDSTHCQAWRDPATEPEEAKKIRKAVMDTKGEYACYDGQPIEALYHSCSGGMTENVEHVWGGKPVPYLTAVESPGEEMAENRYKDSVTMTKEAFVAALKKSKPECKATAKDVYTGMGQIKRSASGRILSMQIGDAVFSGKELRNIFELRSAHIRFSEDGEKITLITYGFGHGVGLSQYGANARAKEGMNYIEILQFYYKGITVENR